MANTRARRGWEKINEPSPIDKINTLIGGMSHDEKQVHRVAFLHLLQSMSENEVDVVMKDGNILNGKFHTASLFQNNKHQVVIKGAKIIKNDIKQNKNENTTIIDYSSIITITNKKVLNLIVKNSTEFHTDSSIKKHGDMSYLEGRNLESVDSSWLTPETCAQLSSTKSDANWNQFEVNKRLFKVKDTYDENLYTKKIDYTSMTPEQIATAERLAKEIESQASDNIHIMEERGQLQQTDMDEEDRFSGVIRNNESNKGKFSPHSAPPGMKKPVDNVWTRGQRTNDNKNKSNKVIPGAPGLGQAPGIAATMKNSDNKEVEQQLKATTEISSDSGKNNNESISEKDVSNKDATVIDSENKDSATKGVVTDGNDEEKPKSKLNANAKEFKFNASAHEFVPGGRIAPPPAQPSPVLSGGTTPVSQESPHVGGMVPPNQPAMVQFPQAGAPMMPMIPMMQGMVMDPNLAMGMTGFVNNPQYGQPFAMPNPGFGMPPDQFQQFQQMQLNGMPNPDFNHMQMMPPFGMPPMPPNNDNMMQFSMMHPMWNQGNFPPNMMGFGGGMQPQQTHMGMNMGGTGSGSKGADGRNRGGNMNRGGNNGGKRNQRYNNNYSHKAGSPRHNNDGNGSNNGTPSNSDKNNDTIATDSKD